MQVSVLESVEDPQQLVVVGGTHLYFRPEADHIRLLQAGLGLQILRQVMALYQNKVSSSNMAWGKWVWCSICKLNKILRKNNDAWMCCLFISTRTPPERCRWFSRGTSTVPQSLRCTVSWPLRWRALMTLTGQKVRHWSFVMLLFFNCFDCVVSNALLHYRYLPFFIMRIYIRMMKS